MSRPHSFSRLRRPFFLLFSLILLGAFVRFWNLSGLPNGSHGDEGIVGYEARRILETGSIGPYSPASWGQPSGPIYLVAPVLALGGNELWVVRFIPALVGTLAIWALYGMVAPRLGRKVALVSAFVLAFLTWHVHYARIAFPLESWPLAAILIIWALLFALEKPSWERFALAGFLNGVGVYVYKAHPLFLLISSLFGLVYLLKNRDCKATSKALFTAIYVISVLLAANFLIRFALSPGSGYGGQFALASVFNSQEWLAHADNPTGRVLLLASRYLGFWKNAFGGAGEQIDWVDASGIVPLVPLGFAILFLVGFFDFRARHPLLIWSRLIVVFMPIAHVVTLDGFARRTFPLAPFLCVLAGWGAVQILNWGAQLGAKSRVLARASVAALLLIGALQFGRDYFVKFANDERQAWTFCDELTKSLDYAKTLAQGTPIYFYSARWSITYDTRKFLAPDLNALDASAQFSGANIELWPRKDDRSKPVLIFLGSYKFQVERVKREYPGGEVVVGPPSVATRGEPSFVAYEMR